MRTATAVRVGGGRRSGFSLLEMIIAIFLVAVVLATVVLIIAANLNALRRAGDVTAAAALARSQIEEVRSLDFPPVYHDRQVEFGESPVGQPGSGTVNYAPAEFRNRFKVERFVAGYAADGSEVALGQNGFDGAVMLKIVVYVLRRKDNMVLSKTVTHVTRNGLY